MRGRHPDKYPVQPGRTRGVSTAFQKVEQRGYIPYENPKQAGDPRDLSPGEPSLGLLVAWAATLSPLLLPRVYEAGRCQRCARHDVKGVKRSDGSWVVRRDGQRRASHINL